MSGIIGLVRSKSGIIGTGHSMVLLEKYTASSDSDKTFTLTNYKTFNEYQFVLNQLTPANTGTNLQVFLGTSGSIFSSTDNYRVGIHRWYYGGSGEDLTTVDDSQHTMLAHASSVKNYSGGGVNGFISLYSPRNSSIYTSTSFKYNSYTSNDYVYNYSGGGFRLSAEDNTRVLFNTNGGNIKDGTITLYGIRDA